MSITVVPSVDVGLLSGMILALTLLAGTAQAETSAQSEPVTTSTLRNGICEAS